MLWRIYSNTVFILQVFLRMRSIYFYFRFQILHASVILGTRRYNRTLTIKRVS